MSVLENTGWTNEARRVSLDVRQAKALLRRAAAVKERARVRAALAAREDGYDGKVNPHNSIVRAPVVDDPDDSVPAPWSDGGDYRTPGELDGHLPEARMSPDPLKHLSPEALTRARVKYAEKVARERPGREAGAIQSVLQAVADARGDSKKSVFGQMWSGYVRRFKRQVHPLGSGSGGNGVKRVGKC